MTVLAGAGSSPSGTTDLADLIARLRSAAGDFPQRDTLNGALTAEATSITFTAGTAISANELIDIDIETIRVTAKATNTTGTIVRAVYDSAAAAHSDGAEVVISPRFHAFEYRRAINKALEAISYAYPRPVWDTSQSWSSTKRTYEVPAVATDVFMVGYKPDTLTDLEPLAFEYLPSLPTGVSSTGKGLRMTAGWRASGTVYIGYLKPWTLLDGVSDTLDSEYPKDAVDVIEYGAMAYLLDNELFERLAYTQAHALPRVTPHVSQPGDIRIAAREMLQKFLVRRSEMAVRRPIQTSWVR